MTDNITAKDASGSTITLSTSESGGVHTVRHLTQPFSAILEGGLTELIGINEQVDQNEYAASVSVALAGTYSGELVSVALYTTEDGSGGIRTPQGWLIVYDADPSISAGDTAASAASAVTVVGTIQVLSTDWISDANGGIAMLSHKPIPFHALATLYFSFFLESATSFNDAGGDDEQLEFNIWYRRES